MLAIGRRFVLHFLAERRTVLLALTEVDCSALKAVELVSCPGGRGFRTILTRRIILDRFGSLLERAVLSVVARNGNDLGLRMERGVQSH
jgi:hypothetical protein